ncbi:MAG: YqgE/AlgH family protein [Deltaproteobacteria bacterium]|nr:YqgE/AlgH family protein [Deltaproteobacteria bacterium]
MANDRISLSIILLTVLVFFAAARPEPGRAAYVRPVSIAPPGQAMPQPYHRHALVNLSRGKFLVARRGMRDARFAGTVILLLEYGDQGVAGVIINRPTKASLAEAMPETKGGRFPKDRVYIGGPVDLDIFLMLVKGASQPPASQHVFGDVYVTSNRETFGAVAGDEGRAGRFRLYAGYAGWAKAQLDNEVARGDWYVADGNPEDIFDADAADVWGRIMRGLEE